MLERASQRATGDRRQGRRDNRRAATRRNSGSGPRAGNQGPIGKQHLPELGVAFGYMGVWMWAALPSPRD